MVSLIGAILLIATWFVLTFLVPVGLGIVHVLLAAGVMLLMRWWALQHEPPSDPAA